MFDEVIVVEILERPGGREWDDDEELLE